MVSDPNLNHPNLNPNLTMVSDPNLTQFTTPIYRKANALPFLKLFGFRSTNRDADPAP
jgi:hypothetical protein